MKALVIHAYRKRPSPRRLPERRLEEAVALTHALGVEVAASRLVPMARIQADTFIGRGKVAEIGRLATDKGAGLVVLDCELGAIQQRNLEQAWEVKVIDRTALILEIFGRRAHTREGELQVELAHLQYQRGRLVRTWTHLERQRGGYGFLGGPGERQIEADRRLIDERIRQLKADLEDVRRTRGIQRRARTRVPYPTAALVGYTNAGKSTLFNRLVGADVPVADMLFATLDPTLRLLELPSGRRLILSDTVGFISDLPPELVAAFRATLEEVIEADIIIHVEDAAEPDARIFRREVEKVLEDLGVRRNGPDLILVRNKRDLLKSEPRPENNGEGVLCTVHCSALTGTGLDQLYEALEAAMAGREVEARFVLPVSAGKARAWLHRHGQITGEKAGAREIDIRLRIAPRLKGYFEKHFAEEIGRPARRAS